VSSAASTVEPNMVPGTAPPTVIAIGSLERTLHTGAWWPCSPTDTTTMLVSSTTTCWSSLTVTTLIASVSTVTCAESS